MKDLSWSLNLQNFSPLRVPSLLSKPHPVSCVSWGWFGQEGRSVVSKMRQDDGQECSFSVITFQLALRTEARGGGSWAGRGREKEREGERDPANAGL